MLAGSRMPCQWIDASSSSVLATFTVTVSPSFQRSVGAGTAPFTVNAIFGLPVKFIGVSPIRRSKSDPGSVFNDAGVLPWASAAVRQPAAVAIAPPATSPFTKVRRDTDGAAHSCDERRCGLIIPLFGSLVPMPFVPERRRRRHGGIALQEPSRFLFVAQLRRRLGIQSFHPFDLVWRERGQAADEGGPSWLARFPAYRHPTRA